MTRRRIPLWLVAALLFVVAAGLAWWLVTRSETTVTLSDGRQVTLLATTYGTNHWFYEGKAWVKLIRNYISPQRANQLGLRSYRHVSDGTNLVIWTWWRRLGAHQVNLFASVCDRHGIESEPTSAVVVSSAAPQAALVSWQFKNFPRRQKKILLRIYERDPRYHPHCIGEMEVPNLAFGRFVDWPASAAPVSVQQGELDFSLQELRSGGPMPAGFKLPRGSIAPWTTAAFVVKRNGVSDPAWRIRRIDALGASGNSFSLAVPPGKRQGVELITSFGHMLWPDESAWRLKVEFSPEINFATDELWTARAVPLRRDSHTVLSNLNVAVQGTTLTSLELAILPPTAFQPGTTRRNATLKLEYSPSVPGLRVDLLKAVDDHGRVLGHDDGLDFPPGTYATRFETYADSRSVDLTFAVRQSRVVEFLVKPVFALTNAPAAIPPSTKPATNAPR